LTFESKKVLFKKLAIFYSVYPKKMAKTNEAQSSKTTKKSDTRHGSYHHGVEVKCICGAEFTINATVPGPVKVETCYQCSPVYNKDKVIKQIVK